MNKKLPIILIGDGGHARVLLDVLLLCGIPVIGVTVKEKPAALYNTLVIGEDDDILNYSANEIMLVNGLGFAGTAEKRAQIYDYFKEKGYRFEVLVHPSAILSQMVHLAEGVQIMAGAVIQVGCRIGENSVINTHASVDHDCIIGRHVHIAPGAILAGGVKVGNKAYIGAGATVIQGISIGNNSIVAAGAVVVHDVPDNVTVIGVPARVLQK